MTTHLFRISYIAHFIREFSEETGNSWEETGISWEETGDSSEEMKVLLYKPTALGRMPTYIVSYVCHFNIRQHLINYNHGSTT